MKKILLLFLFISSLSLAQDKFHKVSADNKKTMAEQKENGEFLLIFPDAIKEDQINRSASFYKQYFTVSFNDKKKQVKIKMVTNDASSRMIIKRFLIANKIKTVSVDSRELSVDEFYTEYLK